MISRHSTGPDKDAMHLFTREIRGTVYDTTVLSVWLVKFHPNPFPSGVKRSVPIKPHDAPTLRHSDDRAFRWIPQINGHGD